MLYDTVVESFMDITWIYGRFGFEFLGKQARPVIVLFCQSLGKTNSHFHNVTQDYHFETKFVLLCYGLTFELLEKESINSFTISSNSSR